MKLVESKKNACNDEKSSHKSKWLDNFQMIFIEFMTTLKKNQGQNFSRPFCLFDYNRLHETPNSPNRFVWRVVVVIDHHYQTIPITMNHRSVRLIIDVDVVLLVNQLNKKKKRMRTFREKILT